MPRAHALGAERSERLSTTTAEGRTSSPQARRQVKRETLAQPAPQSKPGPAGEAAVQGGERDTRQPAGDAPLHATEGQGPDQPDQAPPQGEVRLAATAVLADPLPGHGLHLRLDREHKHLDVAPVAPAIAPQRPGQAP